MGEKEVKKEKTFYKKWWFWFCIAIFIIVFTIIILNYNKEKTIVTSEGKTYTAEELVNKIKERNTNIGKIVIYNEENDLNKLLGRPNQYTSKATFEDFRIEQSNLNLDPEYFSKEEIEEPIGGTIEVFNNEEDMRKRKDYVDTISSSISALSKYSYGEKIYLLRLDHSLTPSQAKEYEEIFYDIIKTLT